MDKTLQEYGIEELIRKGELRDTGECAACGVAFDRGSRLVHGPRIFVSRGCGGFVCAACYARGDVDV